MQKNTHQLVRCLALTRQWLPNVELISICETPPSLKAVPTTYLADALRRKISTYLAETLQYKMITLWQ